MISPVPFANRPSRSVYILLSFFVLLATAYSVINPLHEATDELRHYRFVRYIVVNKGLPVQGQEPCRSQSHHPPLFYVLGAAATFWVDAGDVCLNPSENPFWAYRYWDVGVDNKNQYLHDNPNETFPWSGDALAAHIIRFVNVLIGAGTVYLTWLIGREMMPKRPSFALGAAAIIGFNPMFLYMSGAINNDVIAAFSGALVLLGCVRLLRDPAGLSRRWGIWLGVAFGIALLSKFNLAASGLLIGVTGTWVAWQKKQWRRWVEFALLSLVFTLLVSGWWFVRNQYHYGEPTGFQTVTELWGVRDPRESLGLAVQELPYAWTTLWARFGFGQIPLPQWVYSLLGYVVGGALVSGLVGWRKRPTYHASRIAFPLLWLNVLLYFGVLFNYMLVSPAGPMGRFFFPGMPAFALLIYFGLDFLAKSVVRRAKPLFSHFALRTSVAWFTTAVMLTFSLISLLVYIRPAYIRPPTFADSDVPNIANVQFDTFATLRGYELQPQTIQPGQPLTVDLYWEVLDQPIGNFLLFLHVIDNETGAIIAQRDTHTGLGKFPSGQWRAGDRFVDSIGVYLPEGTYSPSNLTVSIGLYVPEAYRIGISQDGEFLGDALTLGKVDVASLPSDVPNPQNENFENVAWLAGYDVNRRGFFGGETAEVTLFWQNNVPDDYVVRVQLVADWGDVVAEGAGGQTNLLTNSQTIQVPIPAGLPEGAYKLDLIVLDGEGRRLNRLADAGNWIDNHLWLTPVRLIP